MRKTVCHHQNPEYYVYKRDGKRCKECVRESVRLGTLKRKTFLGDATEAILDSLGKEEVPIKIGNRYQYKTKSMVEYSISGSGRWTWSDYLSSLKETPRSGRSK